jgi:hypothetical protein
MKYICYVGLAHAIMEIVEGHYLPSASWRLRKLVVQFHCTPEGLRTRGAHLVSPLESKGLRMRNADMKGKEKMDRSKSKPEKKTHSSSTFSVFGLLMV